MGVTTHGYNMGGGYIFHPYNHIGIVSLQNYQLEFDYRLPLKRSEISNTSSLLLGRNIDFEINTKNDSLGWFKFTYSMGIGYSRVENFNLYDDDHQFVIKKVTNVIPSFKMEVSKQFNDGLVYFSANHCGLGWYALGFKTIISKIKRHYQ